MDEVFLSRVREQTRTAFTELLAAARLRRDSIVVIGCSSSEIAGQRIGTCSSADCAEAVYGALAPIAQENGLYLAFQCCEHLNRALVVEESCAERYDLEVVNAVPWAHGGGAMGTTAYNQLRRPVLVSRIKASAGMDIGGTLIGLHLREVAVPVRVSVDHIGSAILLLARTRPRFVGGERARYNPELL